GRSSSELVQVLVSANFLPPGGKACAVVRRSGGDHLRRWPVPGIFRRPYRCAAGRCLPDHLPPRSGGLAVDGPLSGHGVLAGAVLALVGVVNIPIIYFSVKWWNTLHQGASVSLTRAPTMAATMLTGMAVMAFGFWFYSIAAALTRARCIMLERERASEWVGDYARRSA